jgi:membrane-bound metal-dependent hydrolase YbcI (DUF457 family)
MIFEAAWRPLSFSFFFEATIASFAAFAILILTAVLVGILTDLLVAGFRPILAFLFTRTNFPIPGRVKEPVSLVSKTAGAANWFIIPEAVYRAR